MADVSDLYAVSDQVVLAGYANMCENCTFGSRHIVNSDVHDALLERDVARTIKAARDVFGEMRV